MQNSNGWFLKECVDGGNGYQCMGKGEPDLKLLSRETVYEWLGKKGDVGCVFEM